ncbi:MAG: polysaccharide biosynthesis protein [Pseudolysinimonas sp.]
MNVQPESPVRDYTGKKVLITGGTGSFGHTVARSLLDSGASEVRVLSRDEAKQDAMRHEFEDSRLRLYIGDVRDYSSVERAARGVDFAFHAAALKQVPSGEFFPMEVVRTNILGTDNVIRACDSRGVESLVCLSTDKAVYPVNAMGMSKALMERVAQAFGLDNPNASLSVSCVRYGNVMYSRGSVIPHFIRQIRTGRDLTVTDPSMTRFMMTLADSVALVEHAFGYGKQGDLFIRKSLACSVGALADALLDLYSADSKVTVIGQRHAEKQSESLATAAELARAEDMGEFLRIAPDSRDLNYTPYFEDGDRSVAEFADYDSQTVEQLDIDQLKELLLTIPEVRADLDDWLSTSKSTLRRTS